MANTYENNEDLDVLQNLEFAIVTAADEYDASDDYDVMKALDLIIKAFRDIERGREPKPHSIDGAAQAIFQNVMTVCNWRMGKGSAPDLIDSDGFRVRDLPDPTPLPPEMLTRCLKKIRKSVDNWHSVGGSRGYLEFIRNYFP